MNKKKVQNSGRVRFQTDIQGYKQSIRVDSKQNLALQDELTKRLEMENLILNIEKKFSKEQNQQFKECFTFNDRLSEQKILVRDLGKIIRQNGILVSDIDMIQVRKHINIDSQSKINYLNYLKAIELAKKLEINKGDQQVLLNNSVKSFFSNSDWMDTKTFKQTMYNLGDVCTQQEIDSLISDLVVKQGKIHSEDLINQLLSA